MQSIVIQFASRFSFPDRETGQVVEGATVYYYFPDGVNRAGRVGHEPIRATLSRDACDDLGEVPGVYLAEFSPSVVNGKPVLRLVGISEVEEQTRLLNLSGSNVR
jgi:hypothetical protein